MGEKFHENLRTARKSANLSQKEVAEAIGVAKSTYSLYESGAREPDVNKIRKLAKLLGVTGDALLGLDEDHPDTLAAHFDGEDFTPEEMEEINNFVQYVKSKR